MKKQSITEKVSMPYAEALLDLVQEANLLSEVKSNFSLILTILFDSRDLQLFLTNPLISNLAKKKLLDELLKNRINDIILNFLSVLIDRRRIYLLKDIINKYLELTYRIESITIVELYSVTEFSEIQQNTLINRIKSITKTENVKLIMNIDSSLLGGFIVKIGSKVIDTSLSGKLKQISFHLNNT
uniref:ATP synthase CF1 subunit delta n=1 Tax=Halydictyon mirabile TaxID=189652 RepID=A0A4D6WUL1_9FLOR|nr:ATP synthase CF1 subunit delta [Halydictyon mirabile]